MISDAQRPSSSVMDIFNRPPAISEDTLQYTLYLPNEFSDKASATALATLMREYADTTFPDHLWHRDAFELKVAQDTDSEDWLLEGRMRVGDCVDDEWCVVWLLREISAKWDVVISVFDSDGEFLLIEAAEALPSWVTPSNAENRVWIYRSRLHIIPLSHVSAPSSRHKRRRYSGSKDSDDEDAITRDDADDFVNIPDALKVVVNPEVDTLAPVSVQNAVWKRISGYPVAARQHVHSTKAWLPVDIAKALSVDSSLAQKPVETFYTRDTLQLRAAHRMARFPPEPSVLTGIKLTRTAYAQLVGQKFYPPKIFGRWQEMEGTKEWQWRDVGMKIACGFEMLYQESKSRSDGATWSPDALRSSAQARLNALKSNLDYVKYIQNLKSSGYFKGELEGSQLWNELEEKAAATFVEVRREDDSTRPSFASIVNAAITQAPAGDVHPSRTEEDSDDWLKVDADDLDSALQQTFGKESGTRSQRSADAMDIDSNDQSDETDEDRFAKRQAARLQDLAKKVQDFVEGEGDLDGALFADEEFSDSGVDDDESAMSEDEINSDEESSPPAPESDVAREAAMALLVPQLDPSDYGRMPASFYANSQRIAPATEDREEISVSGSSAFVPHMRSIRPPIIPRDKYDGVDSDDETDEDSPGIADEDEAEDQPQVVGEIEINMEEEEEEFLEFARQALGVSDQQWGDILQERKNRGAYIPPMAMVQSQDKSVKDALDAEKKLDEKTLMTGRDTNLASFEAVMQAMDAELARSNGNIPPYRKTNKDNSRTKSPGDEPVIDIEAAMDAELKATLEREDDGEEEDVGNVDYGMISNFLESFKSQAGLSGPVSSLAGRLQPGWALPRDESR
ncbi:uncharacterized protein FIBRA_03700 [Fibroporia radiculosa]|uniref:SGT1-domain-containing protein n=1 Tax=Fibroporia radiculosa TaxID=599839 RepID=J4H2J6_9APHY|nr:uncharacterized protein FIBRA_03700 [Fibroporia radiculosa]CCM01639.1 predicted protein [Fibroporia radiculosa]